jgi:(p)ppGpp synthase/HD superfamily hydrolase
VTVFLQGSATPARVYHGRQDRRREPYLNHLLRVAIRALHHYRVGDTDVACAALLYDVVEDHAVDIAPGGGRQGALGVLADWFGGRTAALVAAATNPVYEPGHDQHQQYRDHVAASLRPARGPA